jgi:hypothetical protein
LPCASANTTLAVPGARNTCVSGINNNGEVAGSYTDNVGFDGTKHGFVFKDGVYTTLNDGAFPGGNDDTTVTGINDLGQLSGYYFDMQSGKAHSFVAIEIDAGPSTTVPLPGTLYLAGVALLAAHCARWPRRRVA